MPFELFENKVKKMKSRKVNENPGTNVYSYYVYFISLIGLNMC